MTTEQAKKIIDYDRQVAMCGKERADTALQFFLLGITNSKKTDQEINLIEGDGPYFVRRINDALLNGWELHGRPAYHKVFLNGKDGCKIMVWQQFLKRKK